MKIEIKPHRECMACHWFKDDSGCVFGWELNLWDRPAPGPDCKPGVYEMDLSAELHQVALKAALEQAYQEGARSRDAEVERLRSALKEIAAGGPEKIHAAIYRKDGQHTKHDSCPHGRAIWDDCERCLSDFACAALEGKP